MIDSTTNPTIKSLKMLTTTKGRREKGQFLVEGVRAIEDALKAGWKPLTCLYNYDLIGRTERGRSLMKSLQAIASQGTTLVEASQQALEAASDTMHPQGIVASFHFREPNKNTRSAGEPLILVCDEVQDPGNLGTILRTAEAAGASSVWLSPGCADPYGPKVVRAAMGAHFRLPIFSDRPWEVIKSEAAGQRVSNDRFFATDTGTNTTYDQVDWTAPALLIVSNEAHGLSRNAQETIGGGTLISIPMEGGTESLNVATAAAVILFEAARQRRTKSG